MLVFQLFAQVLSANLPQPILLVLQTIFLLVASANVVHSNFKGGLERFLKNHKTFFFHLSWCLLKDGRLRCHATDFFAVCTFVGLASAVHFSFKGDLKYF